MRISPRLFAASAAIGLGLTLFALSVPALAADPSAAAARGTAYYVDCGSGNDSAAGTAPAAAWRSLDRVNARTFMPGDSIRFRSGTTCAGVLQPQGSGTAQAPIVVGAYGSGAAPAIVADNKRAAVYLHNVQGWEIYDLDVSNPGPADGTSRVGIYVLLSDYGIGSHYVVKNVRVHDVPGCDCLDPALDNSGGILFEAAGASVGTGFDGISVIHNAVSRVDNIGIGTLSSWSKRPLFSGGTNTFVPITNMYVARNKLTDLGGDGVLLMNGVGPLAEGNVIDGFGLRAIQSHSAVVAYNADNAVMQSNEITGGAAFPPSFAMTVDAGTSGVVYQYNYSHDNHGGFTLFCVPVGTLAENATVRYNISDNDHDLTSPFPIPVVAVGCDNGATGAKFYNNVIYSPESELVVGTFPHTSIEFTNNIFAGKAAGAVINDGTGVYSHNLYQNIAAVPGTEQYAVLGDPRFVNPTADAKGFRLRCGSPALGAGVAIAGEGMFDFYRNPLQPSPTRNIGAYQGPCIDR